MARCIYYWSIRQQNQFEYLLIEQKNRRKSDLEAVEVKRGLYFATGFHTATTLDSTIKLEIF